MKFWNYYFLAKIYLHYRGFIRIDILWNLLFIVFLFLPLPGVLRSYRPVKMLRFALCVVMALLLLLGDSWLPGPIDGYRLLADQGLPSREFIYGFVLDFFASWEVVVLLAILIPFFAIRNLRIISPVVIALLLTTTLGGLSAQPDGKELQNSLDAFFESEAGRVVKFKKQSKPDFDIVVLHVCSLSWDDLKESKVNGEKFFGQFQYLFMNFNTVTAYSGPAVTRLLRANCGQQKHGDLYNEAPGGCYLFENLGKLGYTTYFSANHNAQYGGFADDVRDNGHLFAPLIPTADLAAQQFMFDDSLVYSDLDTLTKWWNIRLESKDALAAVYYNSVTLHEGSHWAPKREEWWKRDRAVLYPEFAGKLLDDMNRFFSDLESSGRNVVIIFVPEHGMALGGSTIQSAGFRDVPLPTITHVPVGIKFIGKKYNGAEVQQHLIKKPASYLALSSALAALIEKSPFAELRFDAEDFMNRLTETEFVAENSDARIILQDGNYYIYGKKKKWLPLPAGQPETTDGRTTL